MLTIIRKPRGRTEIAQVRHGNDGREEAKGSGMRGERLKGAAIYILVEILCSSTRT